MDRKLGGLIAALLLCGAASAGEGLDLIEERAYHDQLMRNMDIIHARQALQEMRTAAELRARAAAVRETLDASWRTLGLPPDEAKAVAAVFEPVESQLAINARAQRDGHYATLAAAIRAYQEHRYGPANQLLVAALQVKPTPKESGEMAIAMLDAQFATSGSDYYQLRRPLLSVAVADIKRSKPPEEWAAATREAFAAISALPEDEAKRRLSALQQP